MQDVPTMCCVSVRCICLSVAVRRKLSASRCLWSAAARSAMKLKYFYYNRENIKPQGKGYIEQND